MMSQNQTWKAIFGTVAGKSEKDVGKHFPRVGNTNAEEKYFDLVWEGSDADWIFVIGKDHYRFVKDMGEIARLDRGKTEPDVYGNIDDSELQDLKTYVSAKLGTKEDDVA